MHLKAQNEKLAGYAKFVDIFRLPACWQIGNFYEFYGSVFVFLLNSLNFYVDVISWH